MPRDRTLVRNRGRMVFQETTGEKMYRAFTLLEGLYSMYDRAQKEIEIAVGNPICVEACGKCCESMTPVPSRLEALYIAATASALPTYLDIKGRAELWLTDNQIELHDDPKALNDDFNALKKIGCPFLADDKTCTIYEYRPLACRSYGVVRPADPWCPRPLHHTESDDHRMLIGQDTKLGGQIKTVLKGIIAYVKSFQPDLAHIGLLPSFVAKEIIPPEKLSQLEIAPAKRARYDSTIAPAYLESFKHSLIVQMDKLKPSEIDKEEKTDVAYS